MTDVEGLVGNRMKDALAAGGRTFGVWLDSMRAPAIVRIAATAGADFVFIDMEHSSLSIETVGDLCEMARACGITPIVRPHSRDEGGIARILDVGAMGIMLRDVERPDEAESLRDAALYPPRGRRGSTGQSAAQDYRAADGRVMTAAVNERTLLSVQIESRAGVERLDAILATGVVDFVEVGRGDLSTDLGVPLQTRHPLVLEAIDEITARCTAQGVACGTLCATVDDAADMLARGMRSIVFPNERAILLNAYREAFSALRALSQPSRSGTR